MEVKTTCLVTETQEHSGRKSSQSSHGSFSLARGLVADSYSRWYTMLSVFCKDNAEFVLGAVLRIR